MSHSALSAAPTTASPGVDGPRPTLVNARAFGFAAVVGPVLIVTSGLLWLAGMHEARFAVQLWAGLITALAFVGVCVAIAERLPRAGGALSVLVVVGLGGGAAGFAVDGLHETLHDATSLSETASAAAAVLPATGILGPLSMVLIGIAATRARVFPVAAGAMLVVAGLLFPVSRIGQIAPLALVVDLLIAAVLVPVGVRLWRTGRPEA